LVFLKIQSKWLKNGYIGFVGFWALAAIYVGHKYHELRKKS